MIYELAIIGGMCGFAGLIISLICVACVVGFTRSTHSVQYVPYDNAPAKEAEKSLEELERENEAALLNKVGRKKKPEQPTVVEDLDAPLKEITSSDIQF